MRVLLVIGIGLFSPALASAQLRFEQPNSNLGVLVGGPIYQQRFDFVNEARTPIEIVDIRLGCGCLQPILAKRTFTPGERGTLMLNLRTLGQAAGERVWRAHVVSRNGGKLDESVLTVAGTLRFDVTVEPSIVAMTVETRLTQTIRLVNHRVEPLTVIAVRSSSPAVRIMPVRTDGAITTIAFEVDRASLPAARNEETLDIYTSDPNHRHLQIPLSLTATPKVALVRAVPAQVQLDTNVADSQIVRLRGTNDRTVRIEKASADHPALRCTWAAGPGDDATLKIVIDPSQRADAIHCVVRVNLSEPAGAIVTIPVSVNAVKR